MKFVLSRFVLTLMFTLLVACGGGKTASPTGGITAYINTFKVKGSGLADSLGVIPINSKVRSGQWSITWDIIFSRGNSYNSYNINIYASNDNILSSDDINIYSLYTCLGSNCEHHNEGLLTCTYNKDLNTPVECSDTVSEHGIFNPYDLAGYLNSLNSYPKSLNLIMLVTASNGLKSKAYVKIAFQ